MARLILSLDGQSLSEYNMIKERYTIGRLPDNDIRVDNAAVSAHHSLIINILNDSFLEDLNSTNGTYVNGKLIKKHALKNGDVITAGHHQLCYVDDQADVAPQDEFEATMVIEPDRQMEKQLAKATEVIDKVLSKDAPPAAALAPDDQQIDTGFQPEATQALDVAGRPRCRRPNFRSCRGPSRGGSWT